MGVGYSSNLDTSLALLTESWTDSVMHEKRNAIPVNFVTVVAINC
jgi:hypothetical protein